MSISKLMTKQVVKIDENSTVQEAVDVMSREDIGSIIVTKQGKDFGIITEKDVISKVVARKANVKKVRVKDVMSSPIITVEKDTSGEEALRMMAKNRIRRLLITDEGTIVGIFSTADITRLAETEAKH